MMQGKASTVLVPEPSCKSTMLPGLTLLATLLHITEAGGFAQSWGSTLQRGLDQTEGGSYVADPGVGVSVWRAKAVRLGNACCFDSPVCGAKLSSCFNRAKGGQVWMGIGVVLYRVSLAVFSFDQTWIELRPSSDDKERGLDPVVAQNVQDPGRVCANGPSSKVSLTTPAADVG